MGKVHQDFFSPIVPLSELSRIKSRLIFMDVMGLSLQGKEGAPQEKFYFQLKV